MPEIYRRNTRRSWAVIVAFNLVVFAIGRGIGGLVGRPLALGLLFLLGSVLMSWVAYVLGDRIVLGAAGALRVREDAESRLHNLVDGLCIAAGIRKPDVFLVEDPALSAFATGRDERHASLVVTRGLLQRLSRVELEGVIAHELAHIQNRDTFIHLVSATLVGSLVLLSERLIQGAKRAGRAVDPDDPNYVPGRSTLAMMFASVVTFMPVIGLVTRFILSGEREQQADITAIRYTRYPPGLIDALKKLHAGNAAIRRPLLATASLWIVSPFGSTIGLTGFLDLLFETHPSLEQRLDVLENL